jgi:hypothetical protein
MEFEIIAKVVIGYIIYFIGCFAIAAAISENRRIGKYWAFFLLQFF